MKYFTKLTALLLALVLCLGLLPATALAAATVIDSGTCGANLTWKLTDTGVLTISGTGRMDDYDWLKRTEDYPVGETKRPVPWANHYELDTLEFFNSPNYVCKDIKKIVIKEGVTYVGTYAFDRMINVASISLPNSLTEVGKRAFSFTGMTRITLPNGLRTMGELAFYFCKNLTQIEIPGSVAILSNELFRYCTSLEQVVLNSGLSTIDSYVFMNCTALQEVTIPDTVTSIGEAVFSDCSSLTGVTLPAGLKKLGKRTFERCLSLEEVEIPECVTAIGGSAFHTCKALKKIEIPEGVTAIKTNTFYGCSSLQEMIIPASVTKIDANNSYSCRNLTRVSYLGTPEQWKSVAFSTTGNYYLLRSLSYNLPLCSISTKYTNYAYTGKAIKPTVTVRTLKDVKLKKDTNYTVSYRKNKDYGTATITITGIGKYSGTTTRTFQIRPAKVQNLRMDRKTTYADLTWKANPDATSYRIYKSGVLQGETTDCSYRLTGLTAKTNCTVTVKAVVKRTNADTGEPETFLGLASSVKVTPMQ